MLGGPWTILIAVLLVAGMCAGSYYKGIKHEEGVEAVAKAELIQQAELLRQQHEKDSVALLAKREGDTHEVTATNPDVADVVRGAQQRDCPRVPAHPGATQLQPARPANRALPTPTYDCTADVQACRQLVVDYRTLRTWVLANGGDKP